MAEMKITVEQLFSNFIVKSGGQLVSSLVAGSQLPPNADYYFRDREIIGELKCLQVDSFDDNYRMNSQMTG